MGFWKNALLVLLTAIIVAYVPRLFRVNLPIKGQGFAAPGWRKVADVFRSNIDSGAEKGAAFAVYHKGELVVEFTGGYADTEGEWAWHKDVLTQTCSSAKGVAAVVMAVLVDRNLISYEEPVATYWPEFAENGKEAITVEQILSHQAGLAVIDEPYSLFDMIKDPDKVASVLAKQAPNWRPGDYHGYHGITHGLYMDQLVRRVDPLHRDLSQFFAEEIASKFGIDFFFGLPHEEFYRAARIYGLNPVSTELFFARRYWELIFAFFMKPDSLAARSIVNPPEYVQDGMMNNPEYRTLTNPSSHGFTTAVGFAKFWSIIANGGVQNDRELLSKATIDKLQEPMVMGRDHCLLMNITYGRGVTLRETPYHRGWMIGTPGAGGQMGYADPHHQLSWAYLTNHHSIYGIGDDPRYLALEEAMYDTVMEIERKEKQS